MAAEKFQFSHLTLLFNKVCNLNGRNIHLLCPIKTEFSLLALLVSSLFLQIWRKVERSWDTGKVFLFHKWFPVEDIYHFACSEILSHVCPYVLVRHSPSTIRNITGIDNDSGLNNSSTPSSSQLRLFQGWIWANY